VYAPERNQQIVTAALADGRVSVAPPTLDRSTQEMDLGTCTRCPADLHRPLVGMS